MTTAGTGRPYAICANCIMDTSDAGITFDARGWCDYCNNFYRNILPNWHPDETGERMIAPLMERIRREGQGRDHDCLIGISGGVDSSYVTYLAKAKWGLRPLLYHVDAGWNSQPAVNNIEKLVDGLGLDLHRRARVERRMGVQHPGGQVVGGKVHLALGQAHDIGQDAEEAERGMVVGSYPQESLVRIPDRDHDLRIFLD